MTFFDCSKSIVENLYYLSGILLTISLLIGIYQLYLTKRVFKITSKRAAAEIAVKQIDIFTDKIVPLLNNLFEAEKKHGITKPKIEIRSFTRKHLVEKLKDSEFKRIKTEREKVMLLSIETLNSLEAFSVYFVKKCADEEIAYSALGRTFCESIEGLYFDISFLRPEGREDSFQNIIDLFKIWNKRLKIEKLNTEKEVLNQQLKALNEGD